LDGAWKQPTIGKRNDAGAHLAQVDYMDVEGRATQGAVAEGEES